MPLSVEGGDVVLHDGGVAAATLGREHVEVVVPAVGLAVLLVEAVLSEGVAALGAEEVLRVPRLVQRRHTFVKDGAVAVGTAGGEEVVVVGFAVRLAVALEEVAGAQLLVAVGAGEVLGVPGLAQGRDHLADDGLVAGATAALLRGGDALLRHVGSQGAEHTIQLVDRGRGGRGLLGRRGRGCRREERRGGCWGGRRGALGRLLRLGVRRVYLRLEAAGVDLEVAQGRHQVVQLLGGRGG